MYGANVNVNVISHHSEISIVKLVYSGNRHESCMSGPKTIYIYIYIYIGYIYKHIMFKKSEAASQ